MLVTVLPEVRVVFPAHFANVRQHSQFVWSYRQSLAQSLGTPKQVEACMRTGGVS